MASRDQNPPQTLSPKKDTRLEEPDLSTFPGTLAEYQDAMKSFRAQEREDIRKECLERQR